MRIVRVLQSPVIYRLPDQIAHHEASEFLTAAGWRVPEVQCAARVEVLGSEPDE